jgi:hypothetical protein
MNLEELRRRVADCLEYDSYLELTPLEARDFLAMAEDHDRLRTALRELNSAIWRDHPSWAIASRETGQATAALEVKP